MRAILLIALVFAAAFAPSAAAASAGAVAKCHNFTGTCLEHGFVCANNEVVPHGQRCDGKEDCADGTDEFMCHHEDDTPLHRRSEEERHAVQQASCIRCTCQAAAYPVSFGQPWWQYALQSPADWNGLMTGTGTYGGRVCDPTCAYTIQMAFYRKTGVCRGWLCCARQRQCITCSAAGGCSGKTVGNRCYA
jgi:hypothetical protein